MYIHNRLNDKTSFLRKFRDLDFILLACILLLGFISLTTMYSTDGGEILFHTRSHFIKFFIFVSLMLLISFLNIRIWFSIGYFTYVIIVVTHRLAMLLMLKKFILTIYMKQQAH